MAMTITNEKFIRHTDEMSDEVIATILVDEVSELPDTDSIQGKILHQGSTAIVINSNITAIMNGSGEWRDTVSGEVIE